MSHRRFSPRSERNLIGVNARLADVARLALQKSPFDFMITEGIRTEQRQAELVAAGASRTMKSKHLTGRAIDVAAVVDGEVRWDWPLYPQIAAAFYDAAKELGVEIVWGGGWKRFRDGPHFELAD